MGSDGTPPFGIWLVDKPAGPTSHDVIVRIRRQLPRGTRVGHSGTLDPFATGLLVVHVGRATRLVPYLTGLDKTYLARIRLGATSQTGDPEGPIVPTGETLPGLAAIQDAVGALPGWRTQRVPGLAAIKVDGERLYRRVRRGEDPERPEREIAIREARLGAHDPAGGWLDLEVRCSKGTYIRQIAVDLGETLGCGAYCEELRRTAVGELRVDDAVGPEAVAVRGGIDPAAALGELPTRRLSDEEARDVAHGRPVAGTADGPVALLAGTRLVAVAHPSGDVLRPKVVLT